MGSISGLSLILILTNILQHFPSEGGLVSLILLCSINVQRVVWVEEVREESVHTPHHLLCGEQQYTTDKR